MSSSLVCGEDQFGPWAGPLCRGGFDFTLLFEESILSIPLSCLFICMSTLQIYRSLLGPIRVKSNFLVWVKIALSLNFIGISAAILGLHASERDSSFLVLTQTKATIPSAALVLVVSIFYTILSVVEHRRSIRPSTLIFVYLTLSILLDTARTRTLWLTKGTTNDLRAVTTASVVLRAMMVLVESVEKGSFLLDSYTKTSKESVSSPFSLSIFHWLNSLFLAGYRKVLELGDLYTLDEELRSTRLGAILAESWGQVSDKKKPNALFGAWFGAFFWPMMFPVIPRLFQVGFTFAQPFLVTAAIELAYLPQQLPYNNLGYGLIGAFILVYGGLAVSIGQYEWRNFRAATMMRGSVISLVHEKALVLNSSADIGVSHTGALTLISTDVETIVTGLTQLHETWSNLVEIGLSIYLLERQLGPACVMSIGFTLVVMIGTGFIAVPTGARQAEWNQASETRVSATSAVLGSVKWIKISGLTDVSFSSIRSLRLKELAISERFRWLLGVSLVFSLSTPILGPLFTFAVAAGIALHGDSNLTISKIFTAFSIMVILNSPLTKIVIALPQLAGAFSSFQRIQDYLNSDELCDKRNNHGCDMSTKHSYASDPPLTGGATAVEKEKSVGILPLGDDLIISIRGRFFWAKEKPAEASDDQDTEPLGHELCEMENPTPILDISPRLDIPRRALTVVLGPVGCGKSTLLRAFLGELSFDGEVLLNHSGAVAFCEQDPWLPNETVRQLITGQPVAGEEPSIHDSTSKVLGDERWYQTVVRACELQRDIELWPLGDCTKLGSRGITMSGGQKARLALARALYARRELVILDDPFSGIDATTEDLMFAKLLGSNGLLRSSNMTVVLASSSARVVPYADKVIVMDNRGRVIPGISPDGIEQIDNPDRSADGKKQNSIEKAQGEAGTISVATTSAGAPAPAVATEQDVLTTTEAQADAARQVGDSAVYKYYAKAAGLHTLIGFAVAIAVFAFCDAFPSIWLKWWSEENEKTPNSHLGKWFGVYTLLCVSALIACFIGMWQLFIVVINKCGKEFHEILLTTVSRAPMSYHATTDVGTTVNRFSQDLQLIDMELPPAALGVTMSLAFGLAQFILICVSSRYMTILLPFLILAFYMVGHFYLRTARQLRLLDIELKAPLYSHLMETLSGMVSIRAFQWQSRATAKNMEILDTSQRPNYLLYCAQRWLTFAVNMIIMLLAIVVIVIVTTLRETIGAGNIGVALSNILAFSFTVQAIITSWVQLEVSLGAVARIKTFVASLPSEDDDAQERLQETSANATLTDPDSEGDNEAVWPSRGHIVIDHLGASYSPAAKVLRDVSLTIQAGEKVAICGRTGSGKSSLFLSLLGLITQDSGSITVDGKNLATLPREYLRSRLVAVPQDPYLLPGTVRLNVDPHYQQSHQLTEHESQQRDKEIMRVLQKVELWDLVKARGGLETLVNEKFLSQGQMQLMMLGRAMMRQQGGRLLLIDEATSSLDDSTSATIDNVVRNWFCEWTVVAIVHKLEATLEYDRVVVLNQGQVLESDNPKTLLAKSDSEFKRLYHMSTS